VQVDSNGVMQFGVRKRHNIRGTRYSLPQPKGGREAKNPILREDQLIKTGASRKAKVRSCPELPFGTSPSHLWHACEHSGNRFNGRFDRGSPCVVHSGCRVGSTR